MTPQFVIDTSALVAIVRREPDYADIADVVVVGPSLFPAPALVELGLVTSLERNLPNPDTVVLIDLLYRSGMSVAPFDVAMATAAGEAGVRYGKGNSSGVSLNLIDLMVYATAKVSGLPILCTGRDFAKTDAAIHPASRVG